MLMDNDAVIVAACRTAVGKYAGTLAPCRDYQLGGLVIKEAVKRAGLTGKEEVIDDIYFGNLLGVPGNVARVAALEAGIPDCVPAVTVDRQCASGLEAVSIAAAMIKSGMGEIYVAGGCESMSNRPYYLDKPTKAYQPAPPTFLGNMFTPPDGFEQLGMGDTAENILDEYDISRQELDEYSLISHKKAVRAISDGAFQSQIVPVMVKTRKDCICFDKDEGPRVDTNLEQLAKLRPLFRTDGKVTAGNSCPMNDGASAVIVMSRKKAMELGCTIMCSIKAIAAVGVDYRKMGLGPIFAVRKLLSKSGITIDDIGLIELNEAFASQTIACIEELNLRQEIVNVNGGAIALGHPLAATGTILLTKLIYEMKNRNVDLGLVTMCIGGGQGMAMVIENQ